MSFPLLGRHNERLKLVRSLTTAAERERSGLFLAEGLRVVGELLQSPLRVRLLLCQTEASPEALALARQAQSSGAEVYEVEGRLLEQVAPTKTCQGLVALAELPRYSWGDLLACPRVLVLDGVQDPGNTGTLLRSARAFGFSGALCVGGADPFNARSVRSAAGAAFVLPILRTQTQPDVSDWSARLVEAGYSLVTAAAHGGVPLNEAVFPERAALVLGAEVSGISAAASARALVQVTISLSGACESLNVAAAGAVLMYEMNRRGYSA